MYFVANTHRTFAHWAKHIAATQIGKGVVIL